MLRLQLNRRWWTECRSAGGLRSTISPLEKARSRTQTAIESVITVCWQEYEFFEMVVGCRVDEALVACSDANDVTSKKMTNALIQCECCTVSMITCSHTVDGRS